MITSSFAKLLVAAFLVLGGASVATARAQDVVVGSHDASGNLPASSWPSCTCACDCAGHQIQTVAVGGGQGVNHPLTDETGSEIPSISEWNSTGVFGDPIGSPIAYGSDESTEWNNAFLGSPVADDGPMSAENLAAHPTCVVYDDGRRMLIQGAALHAPASVAVQVTGTSGHYTATPGDGGFFSVDVAVSGSDAYLVHVVADGQPDAMAECIDKNGATLQDNSVAAGLSGVAISNSTPTAETALNVDAAVDAYNLF